MPALIYNYYEDGVVVGTCKVNGKIKDKLMFKCKICTKNDPSNSDEKFAKYTINQGKSLLDTFVLSNFNNFLKVQILI